MGKGGYFPDGKSDRNVKRTSPTSAEFKKTWIYTPITPYVFIA
jgi:hypothetical protein